jgi:hypothetical protein
MPSVGFTVNDQDIAEAEKNKPKTYGPGNYRFQVTDAIIGKSSVKGTPRIELKMFIECEDKELRIFDDIYLIEKSKWKYIQFCKAVGLDPTADIDTDDIPGKEGVLRTTKKPGEKYMEVGEYYSVEEKYDKPLGPFQMAVAVTKSPEKDDGVPF